MSNDKNNEIINHLTKMKRFEEIDVLGDGAFGTVIKCRDKETGDEVAIKKMKQKYTTFDECLQLKEVKSLRKIKHENVIRLLQVFREDDHLYLVFELAGNSLLKTIRTHDGPLSEDEVRFVVSQMLEGLAYVHKLGFFHRDIKPENLFWKDEVLKIGDFGLAREIRSRPPYTEYVSTRWYRAPEIVLRHNFYNSPVDIWATGAIMAELFTLKPLFQGSSETDQIFKIFSVMGTPGPNNWNEGVQLAARLGIRLPQFTPTPLSQIIPNASPDAIDLLTQLLNLDPSKRPSASQALQHPFFKGPKISVFKPQSAISQPAVTHVTLQKKMDEDDSIALKVSTFEQKNNDAPIFGERKTIAGYKPSMNLEDPEDFDDIFDDLL